jgi:NifU-like protein
MAVYPNKIRENVDAALGDRGVREPPDACGVAAALECGTNVRFALDIDEGSKQVRAIVMRSNGCGYMLAAANVVRDLVAGKDLIELHGLNAEELFRAIVSELGQFSSYRRHCATTAIEALRNAFAEYRRRRLEEFSGDKALICTCFGVSEEAIETAVESADVRTISDVGRLTRAGTGCGSCQMLIQEIIDSRAADML